MKSILSGPGRTVHSLCAGETVYLVKVSGQYLTDTGWLVGGPSRAGVWKDRAQAFAFAREHREYWLGRVYVVRRSWPIRDPQW